MGSHLGRHDVTHYASEPARYHHYHLINVNIVLTYYHVYDNGFDKNLKIYNGPVASGEYCTVFVADFGGDAQVLSGSWYCVYSPQSQF